MDAERADAGLRRRAHAALAYYFDHKEELDTRIEEQLRFLQDSRASAGESLVRAKLKTKR